jgi:hypothetical protein
LDSNNLHHGFLRRTDGTFKSFDPAGSTSTWPEAIAGNEIAGFYIDNGGTYHGFLRGK